MKYTVTVYKQQPVLCSALTVEGNDTEEAFRAAYEQINAEAVDWQPVNDEKPTWCGQAVPVESDPLDEMKQHPERFDLRPVGEIMDEVEGRSSGMDDGGNCAGQH